MSSQTKLHSNPGGSQGNGDHKADEITRANHQLREAISQQDGLPMTSVSKPEAESVKSEIGRVRAELLRVQREIERLRAIAEPQNDVDSGAPDAILAFIHEHQNPSLQRIARRFGLNSKDAGSILSELRRSGLAAPLNLQNGVQRWITVKKGEQYLDERGLRKQKFRQRAPSRRYW
jgi:hypothetical protein